MIMKKILLLIREIIASIFLKNIIINLFLGLLCLIFYFINPNSSKGDLYYVLLGALLAVFTTINIEETYKSIKKEENWQKIRYFYYSLYFEQLRFIIERIGRVHSEIKKVNSKDVTPKEEGQSVEEVNKNEIKLPTENKSLACIYPTNEDKQAREYNLIPKNMDKKINNVIIDLKCHIDNKLNYFSERLETYFNRLLNDAIENIEKYATRKDVFDKILEAKEFIILLKQNPNKIGLLISFLEISEELFNLVKIELLLNKYSWIRIGKNLFIDGAYKPGEFKPLEYTLKDFMKETLFKAKVWYCKNIC